MPKEIIQHAQIIRGDCLNAPGHAVEMTIHWSKRAESDPRGRGLVADMAGSGARGDVKIGVTRHAHWPFDTDRGVGYASPIHYNHHECEACAESKPHLEQLREARADEGKQNLTVMCADDSDVYSDSPLRDLYGDPVTVFSDRLSRDQINDMIRILRRARDQAFGPDA